MATFAASLITPERVVLDEPVQAVMLRTAEGQIAFLPGHAPLVGALVPGLVRFQREDGTVQHAAVHGGFVQVDGEHVVVLAPIAELAGDIDVERAQRALDEADRRLAELGGPVAGAAEEPVSSGVIAERVEAEESRQRAEVRLEVAAGG